MAYSKSDTAKQLGISKSELESRAKAAGFSSTESYVSANGGVAGLMTKSFRDAITQQIVEIDRQLDSLWEIGLTQEEKDQFLQRAIAEVQPYYDSKSKEIEASLKEGQVRTAEDALATIREVEQETANKLSYYDLQNAQTEEEFINRLADITATAGETVQMKAMDWKDRVESTKMNQIQQGSFMNGQEVLKRKELEQRKQLEIGQVERKAQVAATEEEVSKKYNLEQIRLARESAEQARTRQIGAPVETEQTKQSALNELGYTDMGQLPSTEELQRQRMARQTTPLYDNTAITDLERQRLADVESTNLELQRQREAENTAAYEKQRQKLLADRAAKASQLGTFAMG